LLSAPTDSHAVASEKVLLRYDPYSPTDAHTAHLDFVELRAARFAVLWHFLLRGKKCPRNAPGRSLRDLPASRRFTTNGGAFSFAKFLHLRGIYPTPQMGLLLAKTFAVP
jgi:hypothetical protein